MCLFQGSMSVGGGWTVFLLSGVLSVSWGGDVYVCMTVPGYKHPCLTGVGLSEVVCTCQYVWSERRGFGG